MSAAVKILTVSELIQALEGLCESFGPAAPGNPPTPQEGV